MNRCGSFHFVLLAFLSTLVAPGRTFASDSAYTFSINGKPVTPQHYSLSGDPSVYSPGDVIYVGDGQFPYGGLFLTLGDEKECRFIGAPPRRDDTPTNDSASGMPRNGGRIFLELPNGARKVVAVLVTTWIRRKPADVSEKKGTKGEVAIEETLVNPLDSMSPAEIYDLWGIYLNRWPEGIEQKLAHVNTDRVCFTVGEEAGVGGNTSSSFGGPLFPPLPPKTRYLAIKAMSSLGLSDFSRLSEFRNLVFLEYRALEPLEAGLICQNTSMRYLVLSGCTVSNYPKLAVLTELRFLNVAWCRDIENLEFVKDMRQLRSLYIDHTAISALSPLDHSDSIREIHAGMSALRDLPKGDLPSLRVVNLNSTKVDALDVEQFRKAHPMCTVRYGWVDSLRSAVRGTTRLRVRTGGTCHRQVEEEKTLVEVTDGAEIDRVVKGILIDEDHSNGACMCCGSPTFEFYAGERLLAMVGYHHGKRLRWAGGDWGADGELTVPSRDFLNTWLSQRGVQGPGRAVEEEQRLLDEKNRRERRYAELIPQEVFRAAIEAESKVRWNDDPRGEKRPKVVAEVFMKHEKDAQASIELYLRVLGVTVNSDGWNMYYQCQHAMARNLLPRFKGPELAQAATNVMKDEEGMLGAARWFLGENGWRNLDEGDRERILRPLAQQALDHRYMRVRMTVMRVLSEINSAWAPELLRIMLSRPTDPNWSRPETKPQYGWKIDLADGEKVYEDECSDAVWAAFCLAKMGNNESLPAIQKLAEESQGPDKDLLNKAIQLLREKGSKAPDKE